MSELTLLLLRIAFLALMWFFVFAIVYALRTDLFGQRVKRLQADAAANVPPAAPFVASATATTEAVGTVPKSKPVVAATPSGPATRLVITSGAKAGMELTLGADPLTIGRASESGLVIRDDYTSTYHARLMLWDGIWKIQDLDSTNGTFVDGKRVSTPTTVTIGTPIRIGTTTFELRA